MRVSVPKELIREWTESPVTRNLLELFEEVAEDLETRGFDEVYHRGDPQRTQEELARRDGVLSAYADLIDALSGDWEMFEEEEESNEE